MAGFDGGSESRWLEAGDGGGQAVQCKGSSVGSGVASGVPESSTGTACLLPLTED